MGAEYLTPLCLRQSTTVDGKNNPANRLLIAIPAKADIAPLRPGHDALFLKDRQPLPIEPCHWNLQHTWIALLPNQLHLSGL
jgi:hypothetical protein